MNIYVANIPFSLQEKDVERLFSEFGEVSSVKVIRDRETGKSRGFGFVEMVDDHQGNQAIESLNGADVMGRTLAVKRALPRK